VATWLLRHSVPAADQQRRNPFTADPADIAAGHDLLRKNCEICHGYDGNEKRRSAVTNIRARRFSDRSSHR
jgi:cytochrome c